MEPFVPTSIVIIIPGELPIDLTPNKAHRRGGHRPYNVAAADLREDAKNAALAQLPRGWTPLLGRLEMEQFIVYPAGRRLPDLSGSMSSLKAAEDGLQDAKVFANDSQFVRITGEQEVSDSISDAYVRFVITEIGPPLPKTRRSRKK